MSKESIIGSVLLGIILIFWLTRMQPEVKSPEPAVPASTEVAELSNKQLGNKQLTWLALTPLEKELIPVETELYQAQFSPLGAQLLSLKLRQHQNGNKLVDMVYAIPEQSSFFVLSFPALQQASDIPFSYQKIDAATHLFRSRIQLANGSIYRIEKQFTFSQVGYMIKVDVSIIGEDGASLAELADSNYLYSLQIGPQIGPNLGKIGRNRTATDTREYVYYDGQKKRRTKLSKKKSMITLSQSLLWSALSGKYFTVAGLPGRNIDTVFIEKDVDDDYGIRSQMLFKRRAGLLTNSVSDSYDYYIGPKRKAELSIFDNAERNDFNLSNLNLISIAAGGSIFAWLELPIKWVLQMIYHYIVPNYGVAIFILAALIRLLLAPLTLKSYRSTSRMQAVQPKMKALQDRYRSDPMRMQKEVSQLYKKEGVSPLGGCLPIILQMPVVIALANLFYRYFEFRGAVFIPGWVDDLSVPESVYTFILPITIPFIGDSIIVRFLPVVYLASQLVLTRVMQKNTPSPSMGQMKMVMTIMPFMFFFILYSMPSGLIMYWTISNFFIMLQQVLMTKYALAHIKPPSKNVKLSSNKKGKRTRS